MFHRRRPGKPHPRSRLRLLLEELESRTLLSASILDTVVATPQAIMTPDSQASSVSIDPQRFGGGGVTNNPNPPSGAYTPSQISQAYGFNGITFTNGSITTKGDGGGQTIAIVDAYNDPNILKDANTFSSQPGFNLPQFNTVGGPTLTVVNQNGGSSLPAADPSGGWALETALDVEWAHAMAPGANIVLVEASSSSISNLMTAVHTASNLPGVSVVSMSWGGNEFSGETSYDSYFLPKSSSNPHGSNPGVTFVAASGDSGAGTIWPAVSPNVVAIGGTTLPTTGVANETGWGNGNLSYYYGGSGGGISKYEAQPAGLPTTYTNGTTTNIADTKLRSGAYARMSPDVAYNADPNTGYAVYDSTPYYPYYPFRFGGQSGWFQVGGTSAGAPQWSALIAIANQGRALNSSNNAPLSGASQTLPALYNMSSSDFNDITSGNTGYSAGPGYDLVTGRGSPKASAVVNALVNTTGTGTVLGGLAVTNNSKTSTSQLASHKFTLGTSDDPASSASSPFSAVSIASSTLPTTATGASVLIQPAQTLSTSSFAFDAAAVSTLGFGSFQTTATPSTNLANQTQAAIPGFQSLALGLNSASNGSSARGNSLLTPFLSPSADGVMMIGPGRAGDLGPDGLPVPRQAIRVPGQGDLDLLPAIPAEEGDEEAPACDACFMDEVSMAVVAEQTLALASGDNDTSPAFRGSSLALLGVLASSLWMAPDRTEETRKRRRNLLEGAR